MRIDEFRSYEKDLSKLYDLDIIIKHESDKEDNLLFALDLKKGIFILNHEIHSLDWIDSVEYLTISDQINRAEANRDIALAGLFTGGFFAMGSGIVSMGSKGPNTASDCLKGRLVRGLVIRPKDTKEKNITIFADEKFCKEVVGILNQK